MRKAERYDNLKTVITWAFFKKRKISLKFSKICRYLLP